jgi:hypothetical protein
MTETPERAALLLINESDRAVELGDSARHRERHAKVFRPPRDRFAESDKTARHPSDGLLIGLGHRGKMRIDVEGQIEHGLDRSRDAYAALKLYRHDTNCTGRTSAARYRHVGSAWSCSVSVTWPPGITAQKRREGGQPNRRYRSG